MSVAVRLLAAALAAFTLAAAPAAITPAPIVAAERAFAADGLAMGVDASFLKHSTDDAIVIGQNGPAHPKDTYDPKARPAPTDPKLAWWPLFAGISKSGDLGFTTGPIEVGGEHGGHYFTVWKLQPGGGWKWIYDGGVGATAKDEAVQGSPPVLLPVSTVRAKKPAAAMSEVRAAEAALAGEAKTSVKAAYLKVLADDGRLHVAPLPPAKGKAMFAAALDGYPAAMEISPPAGGEASIAGDLVWVYGPAKWTRPEGPRSGWYVHLWQARKGGWKLVFAQTLASRAAS